MSSPLEEKGEVKELRNSWNVPAWMIGSLGTEGGNPASGFAGSSPLPGLIPNHLPSAPGASWLLIPAAPAWAELPRKRNQEGTSPFPLEFGPRTLWGRSHIAKPKQLLRPQPEPFPRSMRSPMLRIHGFMDSWMPLRCPIPDTARGHLGMLVMK